MADPRDEGQKREAQRILDRVSDQEGGLMGGRMQRARNHLSASDIDPSDKVEYWSTIVGRGIGALITVAIVGWLLYYLAGG